MEMVRKLFGKKKRRCMDKQRACMNPGCKTKPGQSPYYDLDKIYFSPSRGLICPIVAPEKKKLGLCKINSKCKNMKKKSSDSGPPKEGFCSNPECAKTQPTLLTVPVRKFTFSPRRGMLPAELELAADDWAKSACAKYEPTDEEDEPPPSKTGSGAKNTGSKTSSKTSSKGSKTSTSSAGKKK